MRAGTIVLVMLALSGLLFAVIVNVGDSPIWESGDAGERFAQQKSQEMCTEPGVDSVYICLGNVVKVDWQEEGRGSTFYEPEGNTVECPLAAPTEMGAECVQLMHPNYCPDESVCGEVTQQEFPGGVEYQEEVEEAEEVTEEPVQPPEEVTEEEPDVVVTPAEEETPAPTADTREPSETAIDNLVWMVLGLGVLTIVVLYFMFKRLVKQ